MKRFLTKAYKRHGDRYGYDKVVYTDSLTKVNITCSLHGGFLQTPNIHLRSGGCPACSYEQRGQNRAKGTSNFIKEARLVHGYLYDYTSVRYERAHSRVSIRCIKHGTFGQSPNSHLRGHGCPVCNNKGGFQVNRPALLYYLKTPGPTYKIGITNKQDVYKRYTKAENIEVLKTWFFPEGHQARKMECTLLQEYKDYKYNGVPPLRSGNSELFHCDILGYDS